MGDRALEHKVRMSEASGMVSVQAHCTFTEATALMQARALEDGQTLEEVVIAVVDRSIRFDI
jgi:AmiR/NasT family two-component response regulator